MNKMQDEEQEEIERIERKQKLLDFQTNSEVTKEELKREIELIK